VIVLRDIDEVVASLAFQNVQARNYCSLLKERLQPVLRHPLVMTVGFDELRDPDVVCEVLQWLMPGGATDREKVAAMCMFNIQVDIDLILDKAIAFDPEMLVGADVVEELRAMA
jgi:hypothetical protein